MSSTPLPSARSRSASLAVLGLAGAAVAFSWLVVAQRYWCDDAFITFRYARNLVEGQGLVYNPGEHVEGYTNFLWALVAALSLALGIEPIHFTQAVSLAAQAATVWALYEIGRAAGQTGWRPVLAPLFLVGSIAFLAYPMTGMETSFETLLVTLAALLVCRGAQRRLAGGVALGLVLLGLGLLRFDGFGVVILVLTGALFLRSTRAGAGAPQTRAGLRSWAVPLGLFAAGMLAYNLWRLSYYPTPLPNTFYAKTTFNWPRFLLGLRYVRDFALGPGIVVLLLGLQPFLLKRTSPVTRFLGWVVLGQFGYAAVVSGDWMPHGRFLLPVLPLLHALAQEGFFLVADGLADRVPSPRGSAAAVLAVLLAVHLVPLYDGREFSELEGDHFQTQDARRIGLYLEANLPQDQLIAMEWGGIIPYYTHHRTLDTYGLTDRAIVQQDFQRTIWGRRIPPGYLARREVDLVAPCAHLMPSEAAARESIRPGGPNHYSYYPSLNNDPKLGYEWKMFQIDADHWWPALVLRRKAD